MFSLKNQAAKLTNVNPRAELHGQDKKLAVDLKFEIKVSNDVLSEFDASLKGSLYKKADDGQGDLIADPGHLPTQLNLCLVEEQLHDMAAARRRLAEIRRRAQDIEQRAQ